MENKIIIIDCDNISPDVWEEWMTNHLDRLREADIELYQARNPNSSTSSWQRWLETNQTDLDKTFNKISYQEVPHELGKEAVDRMVAMRIPVAFIIDGYRDFILASNDRDFGGTGIMALAQMDEIAAKRPDLTPGKISLMFDPLRMEADYTRQLTDNGIETLTTRIERKANLDGYLDMVVEKMVEIKDQKRAEVQQRIQSGEQIGAEEKIALTQVHSQELFNQLMNEGLDPKPYLGSKSINKALFDKGIVKIRTGDPRKLDLNPEIENQIRNNRKTSVEP